MVVHRCWLPGKVAGPVLALVVVLSIVLGAAAPAAAQQGPGDHPVFIPMLVRMDKAATPPPGGVLAARLAASQYVYCAVTSAGTVQCWGNPFGWTGRIIPEESNKPVTIPGLSGVKSVGVGDGFACVLTTAGGVKCWGNNVSGQLGNGTTTDSAAPVDVSGLPSGVKQIAVGDLFACALLESGALKCWGNNTNGQLGINSNANQTLPAQVVGMTAGISAIAAGEWHTCAIQNGALFCWGSSEHYQVGSIRVEIFEFLKPEPVHTLNSGVVGVSAGSKHTCAVLTGGGLKCWGLNRGGELGNGVESEAELPAAVVGLSAGVKMVSPDTHTCTVLEDGTVRCWGWDFYGELGTGAAGTNYNTPQTVNGISGAVEVVSGIYATCTLLDTGKIMCWGDNRDGQLGAGLDDAYSLVPVPVAGW